MQRLKLRGSSCGARHAHGRETSPSGAEAPRLEARRVAGGAMARGAALIHTATRGHSDSAGSRLDAARRPPPRCLAGCRVAVATCPCPPTPHQAPPERWLCPISMAPLQGVVSLPSQWPARNKPLKGPRSRAAPLPSRPAPRGPARLVAAASETACCVGFIRTAVPLGHGASRRASQQRVPRGHGGLGHSGDKAARRGTMQRHNGARCRRGCSARPP